MNEPMFIVCVFVFHFRFISFSLYLSLLVLAYCLCLFFLAHWLWLNWLEHFIQTRKNKSLSIFGFSFLQRTEIDECFRQIRVGKGCDANVGRLNWQNLSKQKNRRKSHTLNTNEPEMEDGSWGSMMAGWGDTGIGNKETANQFLCRLDRAISIGIWEKRTPNWTQIKHEICDIIGESNSNMYTDPHAQTQIQYRHRTPKHSFTKYEAYDDDMDYYYLLICWVTIYICYFGRADDGNRKWMISGLSFVMQNLFNLLLLFFVFFSFSVRIRDVLYLIFLFHSEQIGK